MASRAGAERERRLYVVRNSRLDPDWAETERRTLHIAGRVASSMIHTQGIGDLFRIYLNDQRDEIELSSLPASASSFPVERRHKRLPKHLKILERRNCVAKT